MKNKLFAFSLAELIIAIGVIGVVAAITIPMLMINIEKTQTVSKFKEVNSMLEKTMQQIKYDCSGDVFNCITNTGAANDDSASRQELVNLFKPKFKLAKDCTDGTTTGCFGSAQYRALDGSYSSTYVYDSAPWYANARFTLANGATMALDWDGYPPFYFIIAIDLNGAKEPNQLGKDTFYYYYNQPKKMLVPRDNNDCTTSDYGFGCAKKVYDEQAISYY